MSSTINVPPSLEKGQGCPHTVSLRSGSLRSNVLNKTLASLVDGALSQCYTDVGWKVFLQFSVESG